MANGKPRYWKMKLELSDEHLAMLANALGAAWQEGRVAEPILILWEPGSHTPFHDQNVSGMVIGLVGEVEEEQFDPTTKMPILHRKIGRCAMSVEGSRYIQRMGNPGKTAALTLHVFFGDGPMKMRTYTDEEMRVGQ